MTHIKDHPGKSYIAGGLPILISRWLYLAAAVYTPLACGGALYGWANMSYMLEKEGYFLSECEEGVASCTDQALALNGIFNVGSICSFVAPIFVGLLMARGGPRAAQGVTAFVFFLGALLATLSATAGSSTALMYAAFACFGLGASSALLGLYNVSNMFPGREGLVMGIVNGSFDAGTIVFLVMRALYDSGISFRTVLLAYLCGPALLLLLIVLVLWRKEPFLPIQEENEKLAALKAAAAQPGVTPASAAAVVVPLVPTADAQRPGVVAEKSGAMSAASSQAGVEHVVVSPSGVTVLVQGARGARASIPAEVGKHDAASTAADVLEAVHIESAPAPVSAGKDADSGTSAEPPSPPSVGVAPEAVSAASMVTVVPAADAAGANVAPACEPDTSSQVVEPAQDNGTDAGQACVPAADGVTGLEVVNITKLSVDTRSGNMMQALHAGPLTTASTLAGSTVLESGTPDASTLGVGMVATTQELRSQESTLAPRVSQARAMNAHEERSRILRRRTVVRQIMSREWALFCIYFVIQLYRFNTYVGTVDTQLTSMGQSGGKYTVIFGIVSPLGFFAQFLAGPVIDKFQLDVAVYIQCIVGLALSITNLIHSLNVQIVTFVLWIVFRAFHFSIMSTFLSRTFGFHTLGITVGSVQLVGGLVCLTQTLFLKWAFASPGATSERGNFTNPNIFMLVIEGCALFFPVYLTYRMRYAKY